MFTSLKRSFDEFCYYMHILNIPSKSYVISDIEKCCICGKEVDTKETICGGDTDGCELFNGEWVCSFECWEASDIK